MTLPCKKEKCISYAACLGKSDVSCSTLCDYFANLIGTASEYNQGYDEAWSHLITIFPKLEILRFDNGVTKYFRFHQTHGSSGNLFIK